MSTKVVLPQIAVPSEQRNRKITTSAKYDNRNESLAAERDSVKQKSGGGGGGGRLPAVPLITVLEAFDYKVTKTLGQGAYAIVKAAYSQRHGRDVAIKIISKSSAPDDYIHKFLPREIDVVKGLHHPYLVRFLQLIETTTRVYMVMEIAEHGSLLDIIRLYGCIPENPTAKWFHQLTSGVEYLHARGIAHRDLKCENLLLDANNDVKISDFGFARGNLRASIWSQTYCGSYAYACPEILTGHPYHCFAADVWSMGIILYTVTYGRLPFDDLNYKRLISQIKEEVKFPASPSVQRDLKDLLAKHVLQGEDKRIHLNEIKNHKWFVRTKKQGLLTTSNLKLFNTN